MATQDLARTPRVFLSYAHHSPGHKAAVRALADRLVRDGIECHLDQYEEFPSEGCPIWMQRQVRDATFVLVIASETYSRRVSGNEAPGVGKGARWEGAIITNSLYESDGRNTKFIPVVLAPADVGHIPEFLQAYTRYDTSVDAGYERLYGLLTAQLPVVKPTLGKIRPLGQLEQAVTAETLSSYSLVLLSSRAHGIRFVPSDHIERRESLELTLRPGNPADTAFLLKLKNERRPVGVAFGLSALLATVETVRQRIQANSESVVVTLNPEEEESAFMEMSTTGYSADDIAELRARRVLLDERLPKRDHLMLEAMVSGMDAELEVKESPLPDLFQDFESDVPRFLAAARLVSVLWLRLSRTVESVFRLDLEMKGKDVLHVAFEGERARQYSNHEPTTIRVEGTCSLRRKLKRAQ